MVKKKAAAERQAEGGGGSADGGSRKSPTRAKTSRQSTLSTISANFCVLPYRISAEWFKAQRQEGVLARSWADGAARDCIDVKH